MTQNMGVCPVQLATTSYTRTGHPVLGCSFSRTPQFPPQNLIFDPLDPKFVPKMCLLVYIPLKTIKNITNMKSKHQFTSKSSIRSFFTKTLNFSQFSFKLTNNRTNSNPINIQSCMDIYEVNLNMFQQ